MSKKHLLASFVAVLNNGLKTKQNYVAVRGFSYLVPILRVLLKSGIILGYKKKDLMFFIYLRVIKNVTAFNGCRLISSRSRIQYSCKFFQSKNILWTSCNGFSVDPSLVGGELIMRFF